MATLKNLSMAPLWATVIVLGTVDTVQAVTFYGETEPLGEGSVRSFVELDDSGNPLRLGVAFTQGSLSLPTDDTQPDINFELSLPPEASATAFNHVDITYRPRNYPGVRPVFGVPRFSVDFSLITPQERDLICPNPDTTGPVPTCVGDELAQALEVPEPGTAPEGFIQGVFPDARHGIRYLDPNFPLTIVDGQPRLTTLYDYGFFEGEMNFLDTTVAINFLESKPNVTVPLAQPTVYRNDGYFPTAYNVAYDAANQEYRVTLTGLTLRSSTSASVPELSPISGLLALGIWCFICQMRNKLQKQKLAN
jgi:hypothetical protein